MFNKKKKKKKKKKCVTSLHFHIASGGGGAGGGHKGPRQSWGGGTNWVTQVAPPLDLTIFEFYIPKSIKQNAMFLTLCHPWDSNIHCSIQNFWGEWPPPDGDLLDDLLTPCAGTFRTIVFTTYKTGD